MSRSSTYDCNASYYPSAPFLPIGIDGYDETKPPIIVPAFVDTGADGSMLPLDIIQAVGAEYADTVRLHGMAGGVAQIDRYTVRIQVENETVHGISAAATAAGSEALIGRDVLNQLVLTLHGPAEVVALQTG